MDLEHQRRVMELAGQAFDIEQILRRPWVEKACKGDSKLFADVWELLREMDSGETFTRLNSLHTHGNAGNIDDRVWLGTTIGSYHVLEKLGEGGMGWVFLAIQKEPIERKVALKIIKPVSKNGWEKAKLQTVFPQVIDLTIQRTVTPAASKTDVNQQAVIERIHAEPKVLARFSHPYIAQIYEAGKTNEGFVYFAMEYVPGQTLTDYCRSEGLSADERLFLFMKICRGVQHAHQSAVLHLDLKPSNILVRNIDGTASPKVIDFGIARTTDPLSDGRLRHTLTMGTPVYMCPEAFAAKSGTMLDSRADVYALGVILFELLTGEPPHIFQQQNNASISRSLNAHDHLSDSSPNLEIGNLRKFSAWPPKRLAPNLKPELNCILLKATAKDPENRYNSPAELALDLNRLISGKPVGAVAPTPFYLVRKFISRHKFATAGFALFLIAMLVGLGFIWSSYQQSVQTMQYTRKNFQFMTALIDHTAWHQQDLNLDMFLNDAERMLNRRFKEPSNSRAYYLMLLADIHIRSGRLASGERLIEESIAFAERQTKGKKDLVPKLLVRGRLFLADGRSDAAESDFKRVLSIMDHRSQTKRRDHAYFYLARVYEDQERYGDVEATCRKALAMIGEEGHARHLRGLLRLMVTSLRKQQKHEEAMPYEKRLRNSSGPHHRRPPPRRPF